MVRETTPENYIRYVENLVRDFAKIDDYISKFNNLLTEGKKIFESGRMVTFTNLMETDLIVVSEQIKKEFKTELDTIILEMYNASFVQFPPPEESLPEKIKHALRNRNEATLAV